MHRCLRFIRWKSTELHLTRFSKRLVNIYLAPLILNNVNCHLTNRCAPELHFVRVQFCNFTSIESWGLANVFVYHLKCFVTLYENHKKSPFANSKSRERSDFSETYFLKVHFPSNNKVCFDSSDLTIFFTKLIFPDNQFLFSFF